MFDAREAQAHAKAKAQEWTAIEGRLADLCGIINAAHGQLVTVIADAIAANLAEGPGIHSPAHWTAWKTGLSSGHARDLVRIAERQRELPTALAALRAGELSVDQVGAIAMLAPASHEATITEFAKAATVPQLRKTLKNYDYDYDHDDGTDEHAAADPRPKAREHERRHVAMGRDDTGWFLRAHLDADEGAIVEAAITAMRDDLFRKESTRDGDGTRDTKVTLADGLIATAEAALQAGHATRPGTDRYQVHLHLQTGPDGHTPTLSTHLGHTLPGWLRRLHTCDARLRTILERDGQPLAVGRLTRHITNRLRRTIEHRDHGCAIPGCHRTQGLEIHHITHWEDGGHTTPDNLVCLCRTHHRQHHQGLLDITGPAPAVTCTDRHGHALTPTARPTPPPPHTPLPNPTGHFTHPYGEHLDPRAVHLGPAQPTRGP